MRRVLSPLISCLPRLFLTLALILLVFSPGLCAISATTHWIVEPGVGSDTNNPGAFDPGQTANLTTLAIASANTASPVVTWSGAAAGDVGAWFFLSAGTNGTTGWYKIASVSAGVSFTLDAAIGHATLYTYMPTLNTAAGCGTASSLTNQSGMIDYSYLGTARVTFANASSGGATSTFTDSTNSPFTQMMVGNSIRITGGTNATTGVYTITAYTSSSVVTVDRNWCSGTVTVGAYKLGGAVSTPGQAMAAFVGQNQIAIQYNGTSSNISGTSTNVAGGPISVPAGSSSAYSRIIGFSNYIGDSPDASSQTLIAWSGNPGSLTYAIAQTGNAVDMNISIDGGSFANAEGMSGSASSQANYCYITNMGASAGISFSVLACNFCYALKGEYGFSGTPSEFCVAKDSVQGFRQNPNASFCVAIGNQAANSIGFDSFNTPAAYQNCTSVGYATNFKIGSGSPNGLLVNCVSWDSSTTDYDLNSNGGIYMANCAGSVLPINTSGLVNISYQTLGGSPFTTYTRDTLPMNLAPSTGTYGLLLRNLGINPGFASQVVGTSYLDIGAIRHQDPAGGGSGAHIIGG